MTKLAVIGECMIEFSRNRNTTEKSYNLRYGGDTLNVALYFARLGGSVDYVTAIGDDPFSAAMYDDWVCENIGVELVQTAPKRQSGLYVVETDEEGERSFYYWRDTSPVRDLFKLQSHKNMLDRLKTYQCIYFSGITLSLFDNSSLDIFHDFLKEYKNEGGLIAFDLNYRPAGWKNQQTASDVFDRFTPLIDIVLTGQDDEMALAGKKSARKIIDRYIKHNPKEIIVKCGKDGCVIYNDGKTKIIPANIIKKPLDTTAAGDAFNGAYLAARFSGSKIEDAVHCGQKCASVVIEYPGAIVPRENWPDEL